ncbi:DNA-formamidopyrimidine glycosylase family protein [Gulosibacter faecalis]|jgi:endonuclease-8|uniref:DNA-(apurinic or apyrimidinic site) lyase n=1 Tax=Gulosibacter faecalis TaxID=272240 RepID=A0ABW5UT43_9MICO|nr:DNA-formamidopyrimidine glycosylase family protein [Gulosibacter faecalis]
MPEGDSAYRGAHHLARALAGREVTEFSLRVPRHALADLRGERVRGAESRGKHMLLRIGEYTVQSHFGMDGSWRLVPPGGQGAGRVRRPGKAAGRGRAQGLGRAQGRAAWPADHRVRAVIGTDAVVALGIDLAKLDLWRTADEARNLGWLGPDLLAEAPDLAEATRRILAEPDRPLTAALLDQRNVAGLGNEYVTEMLFLVGLRPDRRVRDADVPALVDLGRELLLANRDRVERSFTGSIRSGERDFVFGRVGRACRRCGTPIEGGQHASGVRDRSGADGLAAGGTRDAAWCPTCQR